MYSYPVVSQKAVGSVLFGDIIKIGGRSYRVANKEANHDGLHTLTLEDLSRERFTAKLIMPSHVMVTTHSRTPVIYEFED